MAGGTKVAHTCVGLGVGASALLIGTVLAAPGMAVTAGAFAGGLLGGIGSGILGNITHEMLRDGWHAVEDRLRSASKRGYLPINHDLARAIRKAHLKALHYIVSVHANPYDATGARKFGYDKAALDIFAKAANSWVDEQLKSADSDDFLLGAPIDEALNEIRSLIESVPNTSGRDAFDKLNRKTADEAFGEFAATIRDKARIPDSFTDAFFGKSGPVDWITTAHAYFAEEIKTDERLQSVVFLNRLNDIARGQHNLAGKLNDALNEVGSLVSRLRIAFPRGQKWAQTAAQTRERISELTKMFYGRNADIERLNDFVQNNLSGLLVVAAPAGSGKSALLANWVETRARKGDTVVRHFITNRLDRTTAPEEAIGHLIAQLQDARQAEYSELLEDAGTLGQKFYAMLMDGPLNGSSKLIIVLDGLDEASRRIEPFVETRLPLGVFVIVSGRGHPEEPQEYLTVWQDRFSRGLDGRRVDISGLTEGDVLLWVEAAVEDLGRRERLAIAKRLTAASEGLPLFLGYILENFITRLPQAKNREARLALIKDLPAPFSEYLRQEMDRVPRPDEPHWDGKTRELFGLIARLKGPISSNEVTAILRNDIELDGMHQRFRRWLYVNGREPNTSFSFEHPRLQKAFGTALGEQTCREAEEKLIGWALHAWQGKSADEKLFPKPAPAYALDWLPRHLMALGEEGQKRAAFLLADPAYLEQRLAEPSRAVERFNRNCDEWASLPQTARNFEGAARWTWFWDENKIPLQHATFTAVSSDLPPATHVLRCLGDAGVGGSSTPPQQWAAQVHPPDKEGVAAGKSLVHRGGVSGVKQFGKKLASWGDNGAIRFWSLDGESRPGGALDAHRGGVESVVQFGDKLVSWGFDGAIRFWSFDGARLLGGAFNAHRYGVRGVEQFGDKLVSWGDDGAIRFWSLDGESHPGGALDAHRGWVGGVDKFGDKLVSWGDDGVIRFWSLDGVPVRAKTIDTHRSGVLGVKQFGDKLVSWGFDGAIRFWSFDGKPRFGNALDAHFGAVRGVKKFGDKLVSWGFDGAIRFWSLDGQSLSGGALDAHRDDVRSVQQFGDKLVSWGFDGAIRFWTLNGAPLPGGVPDAHRYGVRGVEKFGDKLASWGEDGAIRFWSLDGMPANILVCPGDEIRGVQFTEDRLYAFGYSLWVYRCNPQGDVVPWSEHPSQ